MENLRRIRKDRKLTMKQLGEMVGVSESMIGMIETGKRHPSYELLVKLAEALDCHIAALIYQETEKDQPTSEKDELAERLQMLRDRPDLRALLDVTEELTPEKVARITAMIEGMKER